MSTFVRNDFKLKESTMLLTDFFQTDEVSERNVQVAEDITLKVLKVVTLTPNE